MDALEQLTSNLLLVAAISGIAYMWINILIEPGELFGFVPKRINEWRAKRYEELRAIDRNKADDFMAWSEFCLKPIIGCEKCMAGEMAALLYPVLQWSGYSFFMHVAVIAWSIIGTQIIKRFV